MHRLISGVAAALICSAFALANPSIAAAAGRVGGGFARGGGAFHAFHGGGGFHAFHGGGGFHGFHGFYGGGIGLYPYSLYGGYYPYSLYEDDYPDCHFVWVKRTVKHKIVGRGIWTCS
jgi:hypothetical protein